MKISGKTKYYLMLGYNVLKIIGNICAFTWICFWSWYLVSLVPKGYGPLWNPHFNLYESAFHIKQIVFTIINFYAGWKMAQNLLIIHPLKYHIVFWLAPSLSMFLFLIVTVTII